MRVRWMGLNSPDNASATIVATRESLLRDYVAGFDLFGLPDPLLKLPTLLDERVMGTQSTIHGDLNLENVLVGPGGFVWLIDFAQTRNGHPLFDFAHLEAEIIAHIIAPQMSGEQWAMSIEQNSKISNYQLLITTLHSIASRCLFNPSQMREYQLALFMACLGSLKYTNLNTHQKHLLYLTAHKSRKRCRDDPMGRLFLSTLCQSHIKTPHPLRRKVKSNYAIRYTQHGGSPCPLHASFPFFPLFSFSPPPVPHPAPRR